MKKVKVSTVTLNPSIDYLVEVEDFKVGCVNRTQKETLFPGGKGINVSIVLKNLGIDNHALGFVAGFTGKEIKRLVEAYGVKSSFIEVEEGLSRINVKLKSHEETEVNGNGPTLTEQHIKALYTEMDRLEKGDILVLAGSIPATLPSDIYRRMMMDFAIKGIEVVVDATKDLLLNVLPCKPFLIKPNHHELGELFGITLKSQDEVVFYAKKLQEKGARNVLVSMAAEGAVLITETGAIMKHEGLKGEVKNSVGAGDSMVAGFIAGYIQEGSYEEAFKMGVATGSASAFSHYLATKEEVEQLIQYL